MAVNPARDGSFAGALVSDSALASAGLAAVRGLALDPATGHLHTVSRAQQALIELTQSGKQVATRDLTEFGLRNPNGLVFAPSGDQTDDPRRHSLYLAERSATGQILEFSLAAPAAAPIECGPVSTP